MDKLFPLELDFELVRQYQIPYAYTNLVRQILISTSLDQFLASLLPEDKDLGNRVYHHIKLTRDLEFIERVRTNASYTTSLSSPPSDLEVATRLNQYYTQLSNTENVFHPLSLTERLITRPTITNTVIYEIVYQFDLSEIMKDISIYQIIDQAKLSPTIPLLMYTSFEQGSKEKTKHIIRAYTQDFDLSLAEIPEKDLTTEGLYIYFSFSPSSGSRGGCGSKTSAKFNTKDMKLMVTIPVRTEQRVNCEVETTIAELNNVFIQSLKLLDPEVAAETGIFYLLGLPQPIDLSRLNFFLQRERAFNYFAAARETVHQPYRSATLAYDYRNPEQLIGGKFIKSEFKFTVTQFRAYNGEIVYLEKTAVELPQNSYYLKIEYTKVPNSRFKNNLLFFIKKWVSFTLLNSPQNITVNPNPPCGLMNGLTQCVNPNQFHSKDTQKADSNLEALKGTVPELFNTESYSKDCPKKHQPLPWFPSKAQEEGGKEKEEATAILDGQSYRPIIQYPNPQIEPHLAQYARYYYCPNAETPVPGLKVNHGKSKNLFNFYPCCYKTVGAQSENSAYFRYITSPPSSDSISTGKEISYKIPIKKVSHVKSKILNTGQTGDLYDEIKTLLGIVGQRYCVNEMANSFVHTLCYIKYQEYRQIFENQPYNIQTVTLLDQFVQNVLREAQNMIKPGLLKQELYDWSVEKICALFSPENKSRFTSYEHYRIFEILFGFNIFVMVKHTGSTSIEIARHQYFSIRNVVGPNTVVLILNEQNYYEIVYETAPNYIFTTPLPLLDLYNATTNSYLLSSPSGVERTGVRDLPTLSSYLSLFIDNLKQYALYQYIDSYGKMRGLVFVVPGSISSMDKIATARVGVISLTFAPSQPLNLATIDTLPTTEFSSAMQLFNSLSGLVKINLEKTVDPPGLYLYPLNESNEKETSFSFYIPLAETEKLNIPPNLPLANEPGFLIFSPSTTSNNMYKLAELLWQVIRLGLIFFSLPLLNSSAESLRGKESVEKFISTYLKVVNTTYSFHDRVLLPYPLNQGQGGLAKYLLWIEENYPSMGDRTGFKLSSELLKTKISQRIQKYLPHVKSYLLYQFVGLYEYPNDFQSHEGESVFTDLDSFNHWFENQVTGKSLEIKLKIEAEDKVPGKIYLFLSPFPGIPQGTEKRVLLITNATTSTIAEDYTEALYLSAYWRKYGRNLGTWGQELSQYQRLRELEREGGITNVCIYSVTKDGKLDLPNPTPGCIPIVKYDSNNFGAIMPI
jgi:hypothetical protein